MLHCPSMLGFGVIHPDELVSNCRAHVYSHRKCGCELRFVVSDYICSEIRQKRREIRESRSAGSTLSVACRVGQGYTRDKSKPTRSPLFRRQRMDRRYETNPRGDTGIQYALFNTGAASTAVDGLERSCKDICAARHLNRWVLTRFCHGLDPLLPTFVHDIRHHNRSYLEFMAQVNGRSILDLHGPGTVNHAHVAPALWPPSNHVSPMHKDPKETVFG